MVVVVVWQPCFVLWLSPPADRSSCCVCVCACPPLTNHSWKTIVVNTPRTLQEVLPSLMAEVISALADPSELLLWERREPGAVCCVCVRARLSGKEWGCKEGERVKLGAPVICPTLSA